jgi:hypothetical protein
MLKNDVFKGCGMHTHPIFDYYCHQCLVRTVATLCDKLDELLKEDED